MHAVHNARVQLVTTALNNLALAFLVAGFVAPLVTGQLQSAERVLVAVAWVGFGTMLHVIAQLALGGLRQ